MTAAHPKGRAYKGDSKPCAEIAIPRLCRGAISWPEPARFWPRARFPVASGRAAEPAANAISPAEALDRLKQGNARYLAGEFNERDYFADRVARAAGQAPIVAVLACADSRVPPEIVFDKGPGEVFVVRDAGNVVSNYGLASMEFAVAVLNVPLIMVLGHSNCGAVAAALQSAREREQAAGSSA